MFSCVTCVNDVCVKMLIAVCENIRIMIQKHIIYINLPQLQFLYVIFTVNNHFNASLLSCLLPSLRYSLMKNIYSI